MRLADICYINLTGKESKWTQKPYYLSKNKHNRRRKLNYK